MTPTPIKTEFNVTVKCYTNSEMVGLPPVIFQEGEWNGIGISSFTLEQRADTNATRLTLRFPDAVRFMAPWRVENPLAPGSKVELYFDNWLRFTGWVREHNPTYSGTEQILEVVCVDKMGALLDACVEINIQRKTIRESYFALTVNAGNAYLFEAFDTPLYLRPWKCSDPGQKSYIVPVWYYEVATGNVFNIPFAEYDVEYERGGVVFRNDVVKVVPLPDVVTESFDVTAMPPGDLIYADFVYYDPTDTTSTRISDLIRLAFETPKLSGGLGWVEGVDYVITDETTADIMSGMKWNTNLGDGDCQAFIAQLYDDPKIALAPSYWIRDFDGQGVVEARLVAQDPTWPKDVNIVYDARFPSPIQNIYTRIVLVNTTGTRANITRDHTIFTVADPANNWNQMGWVQDDGHAKDRRKYLCDGDQYSAAGWHKTTEGLGSYSHDSNILFFTCDFGAVKPVDIIHICQAYTFWDMDHDYGDMEPLVDTFTGLTTGRVYRTYQKMRFTVEYNSSQTAVADPAGWHPIHPDLYQASVDDILGGGMGTWITVKGIDTNTRHLRCMINAPHVSTSSNSPALHYLSAYWFNEFQIFTSGYVFDPTTDAQPFVQFTDDPEDVYRCMCNLDGDLVDLYRPTLLKMTEAMGLKYRTLVVENDDLWDFDTKIPGLGEDCTDVSLGYKFLVTRLDASSKENNWTVNIDVRPDILIGETCMCTRLNTSKSFLCLGNVIDDTSGRMRQTLELSDYETPVLGGYAGEGEGCV